ncbi:PAS domain S-box protein [Geobacter sp. OR-1]|uniref:PAS domain S-box protein n=1 Tax=Geobacter sp. OR-1 TaxID=1266765 RepID=UPI0013649E8F|nr:PAS domain S-box protein [Geobacter sp. OR-1]
MIEILLIKDSGAEAELIKEMLAEASHPECSVQHVKTLAEGLTQLRSRGFDCILTDLGLPDSQGLETALAVRNQSKLTPVVVLTGLDDEDTAFKALQMDIQDYLVKGEITGRLLTRTIRYAIRRKSDVDALRFSEARYRALFHDNPTMIVTLDADLTMLTANPICACQLGYKIAELEGQSVLMLFHEGDRPAVIGQLQMCLQNPDQVYRWQFRKVRKDGKTLWVEETAQAISDLSGAPNILVVCQDITERKLLEDELKKTGIQNELLLASAGEGIIGLDLEGNQTFVNTSAATLLGYEVSELVGRHSHSTWHYARPDGSQYPAQKCPVYAAYKDGTVHSGDEMFLRKDGTAFPVIFTSRPIIIDGEITGAVLTFNDITERKRAEAEIERLNTDLATRAADLEAANRDLESFSYTVSNDLLRSLMAIGDYARAIQDFSCAKTDEQCKNNARRIYDKTRHLAELIGIMHDFFRPMRIELHREDIDLSEMARETAEKLRISKPERCVSFRIADGIKADADRNLLQMTLNNLLGNAWKHTVSHEEAFIEFGMTEINGMPACFVRDNGTGFDMANADRLFKPFQSLPGTEEYASEGIGLATVERIIRRHGGKVWAEGAPDKGATFWFTLPRD